MMKKLAVVDLFCGCGGMSLGFQNAGFNIVVGIDHWKPALDVYQRNFNHPCKDIDLASSQATKFIQGLSPDVIVGGPPCQDFSSAGPKNTESLRANLTIKFSDIIGSVKPRYFVLENVPRIRHSRVYGVAKRFFRQHGYGLTEIIIDSAYCGVPQHRKRLFLLGAADTQSDFLSTSLVEAQSDAPMTMRDYFGSRLDFDYYFRVPTNYSRRGVFSTDEPCKTIRVIDRPIPPGYKAHQEDPVKISDKVKCLSIHQRAMVQTFPESFKFIGTKTNLNQMIGNAVPVKLAQFIAEHLMSYHLNHKKDKT